METTSEGCKVFAIKQSYFPGSSFDVSAHRLMDENEDAITYTKGDIFVGSTREWNEDKDKLIAFIAGANSNSHSLYHYDYVREDTSTLFDHNAMTEWHAAHKDWQGPLVIKVSWEVGALAQKQHPVAMAYVDDKNLRAIASGKQRAQFIRQGRRHCLDKRAGERIPFTELGMFFSSDFTLWVPKPTRGKPRKEKFRYQPYLSRADRKALTDFRKECRKRAPETWKAFYPRHIIAGPMLGRGIPARALSLIDEKPNASWYDRKRSSIHLDRAEVTTFDQTPVPDEELSVVITFDGTVFIRDTREHRKDSMVYWPLAEPNELTRFKSDHEYVPSSSGGGFGIRFGAL